MVEIHPDGKRPIEYRKFTKREKQKMLIRDYASILGFGVLIIVTLSLIVAVLGMALFGVKLLFGG